MFQARIVDNIIIVGCFTLSNEKDGLLRIRINVLKRLYFEGRHILIVGVLQVSRLILQEDHEKANHSSNKSVINEIRQKYFVVNSISNAGNASKSLPVVLCEFPEINPIECFKIKRIVEIIII